MNDNNETPCSLTGETTTSISNALNFADVLIALRLRTIDECAAQARDWTPDGGPAFGIGQRIATKIELLKVKAK